jgi:hypothetical protein
MSEANISTGNSIYGGKYADLTVGGKTYTGRGSTESNAIQAAQSAASADQSQKG